MSERVVVVGASVAGVRAAQALRTEGYAGQITLVGDEAGEPYDRPPLSKQFLAGAWSQERIALLSEQAAAQAGIELRLGVRASGLDTAAAKVQLADGDHLSYDALVIATGLSARRPVWLAGTGSLVLRSLADSRALRERLLPGTAVVVVGGSFIGAEAAATARAAGCEVTVVDPEPVPMERVAGPALGGLLAGLHERHGVRTRFGVGVQGVRGGAGALTVLLDDGTEMGADVVVAGVGAEPNVGWLAGCGLRVDDGVVCDEFLRAGGGAVYAAGDIARYPHPVLHQLVRTEHWTNAGDQGRCVAHNIVHRDAPVAYQPGDYFWSDQYGWKLQVVGVRAASVAERLVGTLDGERPQAVELHADDGGRLCAAVALNWPKALVACRRLIGQGATLRDALTELDGSAATKIG
jgi:NADPH-dependent 2,4-dienoyl-CoA reductase/sulfur reductase-like enzyme